MTTHLVTFSDEKMTRSMDLCRATAARHGVDYDHPWYAGSILHWLGGRYSTIFRQPEDPRRAWGWWAWKPLIIDREIKTLPNGDILIYSDAGVEFINNVSHIIDRMDQDIFLFGNNWEHAHWCKADTVQEIWPQDQDCGLWQWLDEYQYDIIYRPRFGKQVQASVIFFRVSDYSRAFVKEWLHWCLFEGGRLIDDSPSRLPNHPEFQEHRHDQAILTTLAYREGLSIHYWPASYNNGAFNYEKLPCYAGDDYPILFNHHRRRDHEFSVK